MATDKYEINEFFLFDQTYSSLYNKYKDSLSKIKGLDATMKELSTCEETKKSLKTEIEKLTKSVAEDTRKLNNVKEGFFGGIANLFNKVVNKTHASLLESKRNSLSKLESKISDLNNKIAKFENCKDGINELIVQIRTRQQEIVDENLSRNDYEIDGPVLKACLNKALEIAVIPEDVSIIGCEAFKDMKMLKTVIFHNQVKQIDRSAFSGCSVLSNIDLSKCVFLGYGAFECCNLENVVLSDDTQLGEHVFDHCVSLKNIILPKNIKCIPAFLLAECGSLTSIVIPESVTSIGPASFYECNNLEKIEIKSKVLTVIGYIAFAECTNIRKITLPASVREIKEKAFCDCRSLERVVYKGDPGAITYDKACFDGCKSTPWHLKRNQEQ